jgi:dihydrofolate reductase
MERAHVPLVSVFMGLSLDGCIAGPGGDLSFLDMVATDPPEDTGFADLLHAADTVVLGRNSYDKVLTFDSWPYAGKRTVVLTNRTVQKRNALETAQGAIGDILARLGAEGAAHVYLDGGNVVRQALAADLVDRLTLSWLPVVLGDGIRLFDSGLPTRRWKLVRFEKFGSGLVQARYARA